MDMQKRLENCLKAVREKTDYVPKAALVLGSGLGDFADKMDAFASVDYCDIPGFPVSTVSGHRGRFIFGEIEGVKCVVMQGRVHYYEGYEPAEVVMPARLMAMMGARVLFLTNAAGGANPEFNAGDFMLIRDHIMTFFPNPLRGENLDFLGTRFPDMSSAYAPELCDCIKQAAKEENIPLHEGVYCQLTGPSFETPAEVRMLGMLGADAVGMSTACEAVAANHAGMRVCGVSCITNKGAGLSANRLTHEEVKETGLRAAAQFERLVRAGIRKIGAEIK